MSGFRVGMRCLTLAAVFTVTGCSASATEGEGDELGVAANTVLKLDNCGTPLEFDKIPQRIIAIKSTSLDLLLELGAGDRIVGSAYLDGPPPTAYAVISESIPIISERLPSRESLLELEPDFVVAGWESNFSVEGIGERSQLEQLDVHTYVSPSACKAPEYMPEGLTFTDVFDGFTEMGDILGAEEVAAKLVVDQRAELNSIHPDTRGLSAVWYSSGKDQPYVGAGVGAPEMIMDAAGLRNVFSSVDDTWATASWESVADADPEVIVLVDASWNTAQSKIDFLKAHPVASHLDAVVNGRFVIVDFAASEAGVRSVSAVAAIVQQLSDIECDGE